MHLDKSILIRASPRDVFEWLAPQRQARWDPTLVRATPVAAGRFDRVARALGHRFASHASTRIEAERLFAWQQIVGDYAEHRGAFTLEPAPGGTWVHLVADVEFPYVMPEMVTEAQLARLLSDGADEALLRLKAVVEARHAA